MPLAVAGILAFLLNPLVDFFEHKMSAKVSRLFYNIRNPKRVKAIILVFIIAVGIVSTVTLVVLRTVVPMSFSWAKMCRSSNWRKARANG